MFSVSKKAINYSMLFLPTLITTTQDTKTVSSENSRPDLFKFLYNIVVLKSVVYGKIPGISEV